MNSSSGLLWGKWTPDGAAGQLLLQHLLTTAAMAYRLCLMVLPEGAQTLLARDCAAPSPEAAAATVAGLAALHDLGKATPGFQAQCPSRRVALSWAGYPMPPGALSDHGLTGLALLLRHYRRQPGWSPALALAISRATALHHATTAPLCLLTVSPTRDLGTGPWESSREELVAQVQSLVGEPLPLRTATAGTLTLLGGVVRLADWLASWSWGPREGVTNQGPETCWREAQTAAGDLVERLQRRSRGLGSSAVEVALEHEARLGLQELGRVASVLAGYRRAGRSPGLGTTWRRFLSQAPVGASSR